MPRVEIDGQNRAVDVTAFPRLKFEMGERARICCVETNPMVEWVHQLRKIRIVDGQPVKEQYQQRNGNTVERYAMDFVGRPLCTGEPDVIDKKGVDPSNCPVCEEASKGDLFTPPERRYAMHVIKYGIKPGGFELQSPFSVQIVVWAFNDKQFNQLIDWKSEWEDLRQHDLLMGPCRNAQFQTVDIQVASKAMWLASKELKEHTADVYRNNQCQDLSAYCGRRADRVYLVQDIESVKEAFNIAHGRPEANNELLGGVGSQVSLDDMLSTQANQSTPSPLPSAPAGVDLDSLLDPTPRTDDPFPSSSVPVPPETEESAPSLPPASEQEAEVPTPDPVVASTASEPVVAETPSQPAASLDDLMDLLNKP